jgi:hypothetical protein
VQDSLYLGQCSNCASLQYKPQVSLDLTWLVCCSLLGTLCSAEGLELQLASLGFITAALIRASGFGFTGLGDGVIKPVLCEKKPAIINNTQDRSGVDRSLQGSHFEAV